MHEKSGREYNLKYKPPSKDGIDDITGEPLIQRNLDKYNNYCRLLSKYKEIIDPIVNHYKTYINYIEIKINNNIDSVKNKINKYIIKKQYTNTEKLLVKNYILILLGPPCCGLTTQCMLLKEKLGFHYISEKTLIENELKCNSEFVFIITESLKSGINLSEEI